MPKEASAARPKPASVSDRSAIGAAACRLRTPANAAPRAPAIASTVIAEQAAPDVKPAVRENTRKAPTARTAADAACVRYSAKRTVGTTRPPRTRAAPAGLSAARALALSLIGGRIVSSQTSPLPAEDTRPEEAQAAEERRAQDTQAVAQARYETNRRGLREVRAGTAHLADRKSEIDRLAQDLVVEHEAVRILQDRQGLEHPPGEGAE